MRICGIDEAGRGPIIGPMVMAGAVIDEDKEHLLRELGVKDSKLLLPSKREELFPKIIEMVHDYAVQIVPHEEIDAALASASLNLNWLEAVKSADIINRLMPDKVIVDCPSVNAVKYKDYLLARLVKKIIVVAEHKADVNYPVVSAASVIAKVIRDREIEKLKAVYGDFGSGYLTDEKTMNFLKANPGLPIYRKSWKTWQEVIAVKKQRKLGEF